MSTPTLPTRLIECALFLRTAAGQCLSPAPREAWLNRARACEEAAKALTKPSMDRLMEAARLHHGKQERRAAKAMAKAREALRR